MDQEKKEILLVEDEILVAILEKEQLEKIGYSVTHVLNGKEAISQALNFENSFDAILMDIDLGSSIDGTQVAEEILKARDIPIIFLSSHVEPEIVQKTEKITSYGYVVKNSGIIVLDASIKMALKLFNEKMIRIQTEEALRLSEQRYRFSLEVTGQIGWTCLPDGSVVDAPMWREYTGETKEEAAGWNWLEPIHPEDRERAIRAASDAIARKSNYETEYRLRRADGVYRDFLVRGILLYNSDGSPKEYAGTCIDITERKHVEISLLERNKFIETLINLSPTIIYIYDLIDRKNIYSNDGISKTLGYSVQELHVMGNEIIPTLMHPDDFIIYQEKIIPRYATAEDGELIIHQYRMKNKSGDWRWLSSSESIYQRLPDGTPKQIFGITNDITNSKAAEEEIKQQLAEKEILLREVHHRIKNNMANIEALLLFQANSTNIIEAKKALQDSISRVQSQRIFYDKLLLTNEYQDVSIKNYVESFVVSIAAIYGINKNITIKKEITDFTVLSRKATLIGIIINELLTNVFKYAFIERDGGIVQINIEKVGNSVTLIIQDDGQGIGSSEESCGLGLTIVKMLVQQLNGSYNAMNKNGTKTIIQFEI